MFGLFCGGVLMGLHVEKEKLADFLKGVSPIRNNIPGYIYTAPLLGLNSPPATELGIYQDVRTAVLAAGNEAKQNGAVSDYGVYYRDLNTPLWFGVNEDNVFLPASLYKLPVALIIYKEIEDGVADERATLTYSHALYAMNAASAIDTPTHLLPGKSYPINNLVTDMLITSDNGAKDLLHPIVRDAYVARLWTLLNLGSPHPDEEISVRDYAFFFRLLYSSTYLNVDDSEKILGFLASSTYTEGLVAGIPKGTQIAHKWGLSNLEQQGGNDQLELHDCGIIYATNNPYLLCVMTKGSSEAVLSSFISRISSIVYNGQISH